MINPMKIFRHCARCSRWTGEIDLYCESCWNKIFSIQNSLQVNLEYNLPFPIYSLLRWTDETEIVGELIHALKGDWANDAWKRIAQKFSTKYLSESSLFEKETLLMPAPPREESLKDHAYLFSEALTEVLNSPMYTGLTRVSREAQKNKEKNERWKIRVEQKGDAPDATKCYILVDDLITTGATAMAVWKSLGSPLNFQVWTLACRPLRPLPPC